MPVLFTVNNYHQMNQDNIALIVLEIIVIVSKLLHRKTEFIDGKQSIVAHVESYLLYLHRGYWEN